MASPGLTLTRPHWRSHSHTLTNAHTHTPSLTLTLTLPHSASHIKLTDPYRLKLRANLSNRWFEKLLRIQHLTWLQHTTIPQTWHSFLIFFTPLIKKVHSCFCSHSYVTYRTFRWSRFTYAHAMNICMWVMKFSPVLSVNGINFLLEQQNVHLSTTSTFQWRTSGDVLVQVSQLGRKVLLSVACCKPWYFPQAGTWCYQRHLWFSKLGKTQSS